MSINLEQGRLGRAKQEWPRLRLKYLSRLQGGGTPSKEDARFWDGGDVPWVSPKDMKRRVITETEDYISADAVDGSATSYVPKGMPLIVVRSGILRRTIPVAISGCEVTLNQDMKAFVLGPRLNAQFLAYWIEGQSDDLLLEWRQVGATVESIDVPRMMNARIALPSLAEQQRIAAFLDRETGRVDALIKRKERLESLLLLERSGRLSQALLGEEGSTSPLEHSGISWLPNMPAHWGRLPLKALGIGAGCLFTDGDWIESKDLSESGVRYITTGNVGLGFYKEQGRGYITDETFSNLGCTEVFPGDVLISRLNLPIGRACIVPDLGARIVTSVDNVIVRPSSDFDRRFIVHVLSTQEHFANTKDLARGTTMQRLSRSILGNIRIPLPPLIEQVAIADRLDAKLARIDGIVSRLTQTLELLRAHRASLITAAVTGQIDPATWSRSGAGERAIDRIAAAAEA